MSGHSVVASDGRTWTLGRRVEHDEASRLYPAVAVAAPLSSAQHVHHGPVLDQGNLGSCTGNAAAQCLNTEPFAGPSLLDENAAVAIYSWATHHDKYYGSYPPDDTGSSGLAVAKAVRHLGLISTYRHAFGLAHVLGALVLQPVIIGIPWMNDMFTPDAQGYLSPTGGVAGGHEVALIEISVEEESVTLLNSWGAGWGHNGTAKLRWTDLGTLLAQQGDCTVFVR